MSSTSGGNPLEEQKKYYLEAYGIVSSAITLEENAKKSNNVAQGNIAAYQMYKRASELLLEAQKLEFPQDQWNSASEVQQKVWRAYQMASMRARELRTLLPKEVLQSQKMQTTQTQPNISNVIDTIGKISLGKYSQEGMTRDEQINAHKAKAQEVINSVQSNSSQSQSHLGLPNNVGELTNLITEAALLPKPGIPKVMQQPVQESIPMNVPMNVPMNGLEQLKKTQFFINALANEPNQHWNNIHWYPSIPDALAASKAADLPIFLEVKCCGKTWRERKSSMLIRRKDHERHYCIFVHSITQLATALSDQQTIQTVNDYCIAVQLNVTTDGFPVNEMPALKFLEAVYLSDWRTEFGFASCFVLDPEGKMILSSSALFEEAEERRDPELNFSGKRYVKFIVKGLEKYEKIRQIRTLPPLMRIRPWAEVLNDMRVDVQTSVQTMLDLKAYFG